MRLVIFSFNAPPLRNPRAFRVGNMLHEASLAQENLLITTRVKNYRENNPRICRLGWPIQQKQGLRMRLKQYTCARWVHRLLFPDDKIFFHGLCLIYYLLFKRRRTDAILTISHPFSVHLIGWALKKYFGHYWIVDMGDLYAQPKENVGKWKFRFEHSVLHACDRIDLNAQSLKDYLSARHHLPGDKMHVKANGCRVDFSKMNRSQRILGRWSFFGNTYPPERNGMDELRLLETFRLKYPKHAMELCLYGIQHAELLTYAKAHSDWVKTAYCETDEQLLVTYGQTEVLVNFANKNYPGLPSKLEEYVASGLPIIHFCHGHEDPGSQYLSGSGVPHLVVVLGVTTLEALHAFLLTIVSNSTTVNSEPEDAP